MAQSGNTTSKALINPPNTSSGSATGNLRNKVALKPGRSLMDWIRLGHSGKDLTGVGGQVTEVTLDQLCEHNKPKDAWICLQGKVYNITPYMEYHPGGENELMKGAGKDATKLFNEVHQWVNAESMLKKCFVGYLNTSPLSFLCNPTIQSRLSSEVKNDKLEKLIPPFSNSICELSPSWQWSQTETNISLEFSIPILSSTESLSASKNKVRREDVVYEYQVPHLNFRFLLSKNVYLLQLALPECIDAANITVSVTSSQQVRVILNKWEKMKMWPELRNPSIFTEKYLLSERGNHYHSCILRAKHPVTKDTHLFQLELPNETHMEVPIGYHVNIRYVIQDVEVRRSYTPVLPNLDNNRQLEGAHNDGKFLYLMVKIYPDGTLTPLLDKLTIESVLEVSDHMGDFEEDKFLGPFSQFLLFAAGTGFTPMVKLVDWALQNDDRTIKLMFFNKEEGDILWKTNLDALEQKNPRLEVHYVLSKPSASWSGSVGHIRISLLEKFLPPTMNSSFLCCVCGPNAFTDLAVRLLGEMDVPSSQVYAFQVKY